MGLVEHQLTRTGISIDLAGDTLPIEHSGKIPTIQERVAGFFAGRLVPDLVYQDYTSSPSRTVTKLTDKAKREAKSFGQSILAECDYSFQDALLYLQTELRSLTRHSKTREDREFNRENVPLKRFLQSAMCNLQYEATTLAGKKIVGLTTQEKRELDEHYKNVEAAGKARGLTDEEILRRELYRGFYSMNNHDWLRAQRKKKEQVQKTVVYQLAAPQKAQTLELAPPSDESLRELQLAQASGRQIIAVENAKTFTPPPVIIPMVRVKPCPDKVPRRKERHVAGKPIRWRTGVALITLSLFASVSPYARLVLGYLDPNVAISQAAGLQADSNGSSVVEEVIRLEATIARYNGESTSRITPPSVAEHRATPALLPTVNPENDEELFSSDHVAETTFEAPKNMLDLIFRPLYPEILEARIADFGEILSQENGLEKAQKELLRIGGDPAWLTQEGGAKKIEAHLDDKTIRFIIVGKDVSRYRLENENAAVEFFTGCRYTAEEANADQIKIVTIDLKNGVITLGTPPRDLRVPPHGMAINTFSFVDPQQSNCKTDPQQPAYYPREKMVEIGEWLIGKKVDGSIEFNMDGVTGLIGTLYEDGFPIYIPEDLSFLAYKLDTSGKLVPLTLYDVHSDAFLYARIRQSPDYVERILSHALEEDQIAYRSATKDEERFSILSRQQFALYPGQINIYDEEFLAFVRARQFLQQQQKDGTISLCPSSVTHRDARLSYGIAVLKANLKELLFPSDENPLDAALKLRGRAENLLGRFSDWLNTTAEKEGMVTVSWNLRGRDGATLNLSQFIDFFHQLLVRQLTDEFVGALGRSMKTQNLPPPSLVSFLFPSEAFTRQDLEHPTIKGKQVAAGGQDFLFSPDPLDILKYFSQTRQAYSDAHSSATPMTEEKPIDNPCSTHTETKANHPAHSSRKGKDTPSTFPPPIFQLSSIDSGVYIPLAETARRDFKFSPSPPLSKNTMSQRGSIFTRAEQEKYSRQRGRIPHGPWPWS